MGSGARLETILCVCIIESSIADVRFSVHLALHLSWHLGQAIPKAVYAESYTLGIQHLDLMKTLIKHI